MWPGTPPRQGEGPLLRVGSLPLDGRHGVQLHTVNQPVQVIDPGRFPQLVRLGRPHDHPGAEHDSRRTEAVVYPNNMEKYMSVSIGKLQFIESLQCFNSSLDRLFNWLGQPRGATDSGKVHRKFRAHAAQWCLPLCAHG